MNYAWMALVAYWIDRIFGDILPPKLFHPIIYIGRYISFWEKILYNPKSSSQKLFINGIILWFVSVGTIFIVVYGFLYLLFLIHPLLALIVEIWLISFSLASKELAKAANNVLTPLREGNLFLARNKVKRIVGRDTNTMDEQNIVRATIETVAENIVDGIISPLFYALIGGAPLAFAYKTINTLDSMVGYKNDKYLYFGRFSARMDDVANFIPARLTSLILIFVAWFSGRNAKRTFNVIKNDASKHPSPNSGYSEAGVAGCLGIQLGGLNVYGGVESLRAYMGKPIYPLQSIHVRTTIELMYDTGFAVSLLGLIIYYLIGLL